MDGRVTRNYMAHGGNELVIGGKLTFLPGAVVEGAEGLFDVMPAERPELPYVPNSAATTVSALREDFNRLLTVLKNAGVQAAASAEVSADDPDS